MLNHVLRRLFGSPTPATLSGDDARLALAALLVRVARSDGWYEGAEIGRIDAILRARFGLGPPEAARLRAQAEDLERDAPDTVRFTRAIKEAVPYEDRLAVIEALWQVALADHAREEGESTLLRLVAPMLGVSDRDSALARRRVERASASHDDHHDLPG
jgi:uncharacterized tellurite resistance protein B-like protein